ncbi:MAG: transglutaminase family protein, partial [Mesorhizobium sp.]
MRIRAGFNLAYECPQPTPMLLVLDIHPSRRGDLLTEQIIGFDRPVDARGYIDVFGNLCTRIEVPAGLTT